MSVLNGKKVRMDKRNDGDFRLGSAGGRERKGKGKSEKVVTSGVDFEFRGDGKEWEAIKSYMG